ncbi:Paralysed flagella protein PflA [hydrothermal vent metagenome]|uniref:Paralysed flagella protein PflA n=1 Tax=hydrothermal vent metagenome TaxID=652676 RepID=A0A1W1CGX6_9ZZZZ
MFKTILLALVCVHTFALDISMDSAKDDFSTYSILKITDTKRFICQKMKDDFTITNEVICAFSKKPSSTIKTLQNEFFRVHTFIKEDTFFISIKPIYKIKLIADIFDLSTENNVYHADVRFSNRWTIIGYKENLPLIKNRQRPDISLNLPFFMDNSKLPYVGSLDIKGNPVHIQKVGDVKDYLKVKRYYKEKRYELCMGVVDNILEEYPNTLFKAELIYYKIKLFQKLDDYDNVISNAAVYLREYSSNENIPEILAYTAEAYAQIGMSTDADYFFDRLFSEHENTVFTEWGYIYKADMLAVGGGVTPAFKFYKKALYRTKDLDVAAAAAFRIAKLKQEISLKDSAKFIDKLINAKPSYMQENERESKIMMNNFADEEYYETASKIAGALIDEIDYTYDEYETLLSQKALWLAKTQNKQEAFVAINKYIKEFPDGEYINPIDIAKDELFFEVLDTNTSHRLAEYDKLMQTYANDTIGNRAIYEKAKLLLSQEMYANVLDMEDEILGLDDDKYIDVQDLVQQSAIGVMKNSLKEKKCKRVLIISNEYNVTLSNEWDDGIYECAMYGGDYVLAKNIALKNFKSENLDHRKKWLFRYVKVDFSTGNYSDVIDASKDLIILIQEDKNSAYNEVYRYLFDTYDRLEKKDEMIITMLKLEELFGLDYKDIERYISVMSIGTARRDDNIVIKYGKKVMRIQKSSSSSAQSPYVEFTLYESYINREDYNKALEVISSLDKIGLSKSDRSRQQYLKGTVLNKLWRDPEAQTAFTNAVEAKPDSAWAKLATTAKSI